MSDDFVRELEHELIAAAHRRAAVPARRLPAIPRPRLRPIAAVALLIAALVSLIALFGGDREDRATQPPPPAPPAPTIAVPLLAASGPADCAGTPAQIPAGLTDLAPLRRAQRSWDTTPRLVRLPVGALDLAEVRRVLADPVVFVVPSGDIAGGDRCRTRHEGGGYCLAEVDLHFRCFPHSALARGEVLMRLSTGEIAGLVPDGITSVTLDGVSAPVRDNAYVATVAGTGDTVRLGMAGASCSHPLSDDVATRLPLLQQPAREPLPDAAAAALREWEWQFGAIFLRSAAFWGERDGLAVWIVPAVSRGAGACAPADGACVVALAGDDVRDAVCQAPPKANIRYAPLRNDRGLVFGFTDPGVTGVRVVAGSEETTVPARDGVVAGVAPFPFAPGAHVEPLRGG